MNSLENESSVRVGSSPERNHRAEEGAFSFICPLTLFSTPKPSLKHVSKISFKNHSVYKIKELNGINKEEFMYDTFPDEWIFFSK
jgi:hypothetical protein